ncbi:MAG: hypothetical protein JNM52_11680 [Betaproteobacteria bacterium]|nr:hypothetical protein [Betaproteobacteria bacterium]
MTNMAPLEQATAAHRARQALGSGVPVEQRIVDGRTTSYVFPLLDASGEHLSGSFAYAHEHVDRKGVPTGPGTFTILHRDHDAAKQQFVKPAARGHKTDFPHLGVLAFAKASPNATNFAPIPNPSRPTLGTTSAQKLQTAMDHASSTHPEQPPLHKGGGWPRL